MLPGFFDLTRVTVPFCGNVVLAVMLDRASLLIESHNARRRLNIVTGVALFILAGLILIM